MICTCVTTVNPCIPVFVGRLRAIDELIFDDVREYRMRAIADRLAGGPDRGISVVPITTTCEPLNESTR